mmetsp:Transcript_15655/g.20407  ORF Transcript_15655/g.20407 Transcript_15655/m.20407 type:complete len:405 (+) Transcript_15655:136-1350(+)|eukprot:CAMPEP_0198146388 /NCGR_PEP_ID=MMETSP1443-20131203/29184_1 /TAXON_ID=186043 /ORGANISM="Entomoneis sp., Strain CCMP2396" /LENGTH=404 /DNA_ID=CAMNT_0043810335 /DNA_START=51 /DNA_END=1265 /DNA_ORIENTATION=-
MAATKISNEPSQEVPIFLRKTYHMIDTCDPTIACWSEDGETFVVKDPEKFECSIIPQFFKHSKFSSFVRQLNFYSFRKIKYADTIRIDPKLEAETANYWRFRHEHFRRGRPDLLTEIKRMNGQKKEGEKKEEKNIPKAESVSVEVSALKKRIDEMSKNIDTLTAMVGKVNIKQEEHEVSETSASIGAKRKKAEPEITSAGLRPDGMLSNMEIEEFASMPLPDPMPLSNPEVPPGISAGRETSIGQNSTVSDTDFVNQLFTAFEDGEDEGLLQFDSDPAPPREEPPQEESKTNEPDPELMQRLSDALSVLPKDMQELLVDRLVKQITSTDFVDQCMHEASKVERGAEPSLVAPSDDMPMQTDDYANAAPLAAATFAALLRHYTSQVQGKNVKNISKVLPIIPAHA